MSSGLTHSGAIARGLAYAPAADLRSAFRPASAADAARVAPVSAAAPASERGVDQLALFRMSSQDRISAETAMMAERARQSIAAQNQARAYVRATGNFVDIRV